MALPRSSQSHTCAAASKSYAASGTYVDGWLESSGLNFMDRQPWIIVAVIPSPAARPTQLLWSLQPLQWTLEMVHQPKCWWLTWVQSSCQYVTPYLTFPVCNLILAPKMIPDKPFNFMDVLLHSQWFIQTDPGPTDKVSIQHPSINAQMQARLARLITTTKVSAFNVVNADSNCFTGCWHNRWDRVRE